MDIARDLYGSKNHEVVVTPEFLHILWRRGSSGLKLGGSRSLNSSPHSNFFPGGERGPYGSLTIYKKKCLRPLPVVRAQPLPSPTIRNFLRDSNILGNVKPYAYTSSAKVKYHSRTGRECWPIDTKAGCADANLLDQHLLAIRQKPFSLRSYLLSTARTITENARSYHIPECMQVN